MAVLPVVATTVLTAVPGDAVAATSPPESRFFATTQIEPHNTVNTKSDGDLWPACWSNDNNLYSANGDGKGFDLDAGTFSDIVVNRIEGTPPNISGAVLAKGDAVSSIWNGNGQYNRKPTGMVCSGGDLYLAVQDLRDPDGGNLAFNDAPNATVVKSRDHGRTWTWDKSRPMFPNGVFTTIMFLDYGKDNANAIDSYVYAYGLDGNWRDSYTDTVPDPVDVYLARVPKKRIQDRSAWQFYTGATAQGRPAWSSKISKRAPVLHDDRRIYPNVFSTNVFNMTVLGQGGVVYNKPLDRYIYTSWSEYTFEFYEAPNPWGPWKRFVTKDFGGFPWTAAKAGGYGTTIPSKFISADGKTMWVQSAVCGCGAGGFWDYYRFGLRKLTVEPYAPSTPANRLDDSANLAGSGDGVTPIERATHFGKAGYYNDGEKAQNEDDWNDEPKPTSWWGYTWRRAYNMNRVVYTTGKTNDDGGWFHSGLRVQVRRNFTWTDVEGLTVSPDYPHNKEAGPNKTYTFRFDDTWGDGVRIIGKSGGNQMFTSIGELEVYYGSPGEAMVGDPGFEQQLNGGVSAPWSTSGEGAHGIDRGLGFAHSGQNNAWIRTSGTGWRDIKQGIRVLPGTDYHISAWIRTSDLVSNGSFGVRAGTGTTVLAEQKYGPHVDYTRVSVDFNSGSNSKVTVFGGFTGPGADAWIQLDDFAIERR